MGNIIKKILKDMGLGVLLSTFLICGSYASSDPLTNNDISPRAKEILKRAKKKLGFELGNADGDEDDIESGRSSTVEDFLRLSLRPFAVDYDPQSYFQHLVRDLTSTIYGKSSTVEVQIQVFGHEKFKQLTDERLKDKWTLTQIGKYPALEWKEEHSILAERRLDILKKTDLIGVSVSATRESLKNEDSNLLFRETLEEAL